ncbi:glycosyltransferase family 2 protein [Microbacterium sp. JZ31]|uniref:glycosyltransferase family 2 protein n=1 Tax=Microbacterium sp. JZ31 TaxID=1906274 RepID=UPI00193454EB|nr:glycosyltransferase family A protein [Microbacterium sp. JZ31]
MTADAALTAVEREYLQRESSLFGYLRLNGSTAGRDVLALAATHGRLRQSELLAALRARPGGGSVAAPSLAEFDDESLRRLATLLADQARGAGEAADAALLLSAMAEELGTHAIRKGGRFRLMELLVDAGQSPESLPDLLSNFHIGRENAAQPYLLTANASNPFAGGEETPRLGTWLQAMEDMFALDGLEPVGIAPGHEAPFDRLLSGASSIVTDGPLVTVIIPTYNPGQRLATAVESLLSQSHRALQILIMDDASPAAAAEGLDRWLERDPRIEVVHLPENNGPYLARNIAASRFARGDYVTIHDDDDWSHPRKIELQVAQLEADREYMANMSRSIRASDDLVLGRINGDPVWTQQALNSLMVRRELFDEIGYWDVLNRSADAEFNDRIRSWSGKRIPTVGRVPLAFYRIRWDSLSAGEFNRGYMDPRRRWYFHSYLHWHASEKEQGRAPVLPVDSRESRPFATATDLLGSRHDAGRFGAVEVLFAGDFRFRGVRADAVCADVESALEAGSRVAILQLDSPVHENDARIHPRILVAARNPSALVVSLMDPVEASRAVVFDPSALQFARVERAALTVERLVIDDRVRYEPQVDGGAVYDVRDVVVQAEKIFGRRPEISRPV